MTQKWTPEEQFALIEQLQEIEEWVRSFFEQRGIPGVHFENIDWNPDVTEGIARELLPKQ